MIPSPMCTHDFSEKIRLRAGIELVPSHSMSCMAPLSIRPQAELKHSLGEQTIEIIPYSLGATLQFSMKPELLRPS